MSTVRQMLQGRIDLNRRSIGVTEGISAGLHRIIPAGIDHAHDLAVEDTPIAMDRCNLLGDVDAALERNRFAQLIHRMTIVEAFEIASHRNGPRSKSDPWTISVA